MLVQNITDELLKENASLGTSNKMKKLTDYTVQLGGPIKRDKAFWWASVQRYSFNLDPSGPRTTQTEISPRYNGKLTLNITPNDTLIGSVQLDNYNVTGRTAYAGTFSTDDQTVRQDSPEAVWNAQYRKVINSSTFLEAKFIGYWGYYNLDPVNKAPIHVDQDTGGYTGGAGYYYYADRDRNQLNVLGLEVRRGVRDAQLQVRHRVRAQQVAFPVGVQLVRGDRPLLLHRLQRGAVLRVQRAQLQHQGQERA